jgi:hypothetical protein
VGSFANPRDLLMKAGVGGRRGSADRTGLLLNSLLTGNFTGKSQNQANNSLPETTGKKSPELANFGARQEKSALGISLRRTPR